MMRASRASNVVEREWHAVAKPYSQSAETFFRERVHNFDAARGVTWSVLDAQYGNGCVYMAIVGESLSSKERRVRAVVAEVDHVSPSRNEESRYLHGENFRYRLIDEAEMGFVIRTQARYQQNSISHVAADRFYKCPRKILERLTPNDDPSAMAWRAKAWSWVRESEAKMQRFIQLGDVVQLPDPTEFSDGVVRQAFVVVHNDAEKNHLFGQSLDDHAIIELTGSRSMLTKHAPGLENVSSPDGIAIVREINLSNANQVFVAVVPAEFGRKQSGKVICYSNSAAEVNSAVKNWNANFIENKVEEELGSSASLSLG